MVIKVLIIAGMFGVFYLCKRLNANSKYIGEKAIWLAVAAYILGMLQHT